MLISMLSRYFLLEFANLSLKRPVIFKKESLVFLSSYAHLIHFLVFIVSYLNIFIVIVVFFVFGVYLFCCCRCFFYSRYIWWIAFWGRVLEMPATLRNVNILIEFFDFFTLSTQPISQYTLLILELNEHSLSFRINPSHVNVRFLCPFKPQKTGCLTFSGAL